MCMWKVLEWSGQNEYLSVQKKIWKLQGSNEVAGYIRQVSNFWQVTNLKGALRFILVVYIRLESVVPLSLSLYFLDTVRQD